MFDGWFGVPFLDGDNITHVRRPHSSELLQLYSFPPSVVRSLSPLLGSLQRSICLHVFPYHTAAVLAHSIAVILSLPHVGYQTTPFCQLVTASLSDLPQPILPGNQPTQWTMILLKLFHQYYSLHHCQIQHFRN